MQMHITEAYQVIRRILSKIDGPRGTVHQDERKDRQLSSRGKPLQVTEVSPRPSGELHPA